jgi:hypothetical protein
MHSAVTMSDMKKKKKGAGDLPANNNRSDHSGSKSTSAIVTADKSNQGKGSKGKK